MEETKNKDNETREKNDSKQEDNQTKPEQNTKKVVSLQLGDIIRLFNTHDEKLNQKVYFINYIDNKGADLINVDTFDTVHIPIHENGIFGDGYMKKIELLKRNKYPGYARQHKLVPGTWVNIFFGGDIPTVVTAEITNLEEDMIELRLYPEEDIIYINFNYKGIPKDLRIETIEIREKPSSVQKKNTDDNLNDKEEEKGEKEEGGDLEIKELIVEPEDEREKVVSTLKDLILQGNQIKFSYEYFGKATEVEDYSLEAQLNDMLHSILKDKDMEPWKHLNEIQVMLNRYAELRQEFSVFDSFGQVIDKELYSLTPKPLVHYFEDFYQNLPWIMPVVKNVKHMFDANCYADGACDFVEVSLFANKLNDLVKQYESNHVDFYTMNRKMNELLTSFEELDAERSNGDVIATRKTNTCLNTLVSNFEGFCSSVMQNNRIEIHPYVTQRYCFGENMEISSFVTLPLPFIRYSKISLPLTSILERCNLNKTTLLCWKLFLNEPIINDVYITNLNASLNYSADNFGNNMKNYILNLQSDEARSLSKSEIYKKFVLAMIPKTSVLFDIMKRYMQREFTLTEAIDVLEPFLVYSQNVTAMLLPEMQSFLKSQISLYKKRISSESRSFSLLKKLQSSKEVSVFSKSLLDVLDRKNANKEDVLEAYDIDTELTSSSSDLYLKMFGSDYGRLFTDSVSLANIPLMFPKEMSDLLESESNNDNKEGKQHGGGEDGEKKKQDDDISMCNGKKLVIAKSYKSEKELLDDNDQELFFDKVFDKTNYAILDDYETEMQTMPAEDFIDFLPKALEEKYQLPKEEAEYLSDTLISGSKRVIDGQYAIISIKDADDKNKSDIFYFKRVNNQWELDEDAVKMDVITTDDNLFCNLQEKCIAENKSIEANNTCESMKLNKVELQEDLLNQMLNEFDKKYFLSKEKFTKQLQSEYDEALARLPRLLYLKKHKWLKYNNQHYKLGFVYAEQQQGGSAEKVERISFRDDDNDESKTNELSDVVYVSPFAKTLDAILSQADFVKKHYDIATFANEFTREAFSSGLGPLGKKETIHWMYCIKTNVPLLPSFLATLATCFTNTPLQFTDCLWSIIRTNGVCKNNIWYDKYTGYPICNEFLSKNCDDADANKMRELKMYTKVQLLSSNEMKMIGKVVKQMEELMSLSLHHSRDFINFMISTMLATKVPNEEEYLRRTQKSSNKPVPYHLFFQRNLVFFTLAAILVAIQTAVPGIRTRKTLPGCVRCFTGYPFDSTSMDTSSIQYLATLAYKQKQSEEPWSSLKKFDKEMLIKGIRSALDQGLLQLNEVRRKIEEKKLSVVKMSREKQSKALEEWSGFLPPLKPIKLTHLINVTPEFKSSLLRDLKHGAANQRNKILVVESKIVQYSFAIQEKINDIVKKKVEASQVMTSCCEDMQDYSTAVKEYNDIVNNLSQILHDIRFSYVQSHLWCTHTSSAFNFPSLNHLTFDEKTMYLGLIQYCNLRNFCPIPDELLPICESKPNHIRIGNTIDDIIIKLKEDKRDMSQATFQRLLQLVGRNHMMKNMFTLDDDFDNEKEEQKEKERDEELFIKSLKGFETDMVDVFEKWFMERRNSERNKKGNNSEKQEDSEILKFLKLKNDAMKAEILHFLEVNKNCSLELKPLKKVLDNLRNNTKLKYYIHRFSQVLPKMMVEEVDNIKSEFPHTWNLNAHEEQKLAESVSSALSSYRRFYNQNGMNIVLLDLLDSNKSFCQLCNLITMNTVDDVSDMENENKRYLLEAILLKLFLQYIHWIKQEDHGCFTLSKKDNIKLNTENLREYNFKMCDLIVAFLNEIKDGNEINRRDPSMLIKKRENERRQKRRHLSLERSEEDREMEDILSHILQN